MMWIQHGCQVGYESGPQLCKRVSADQAAPGAHSYVLPHNEYQHYPSCNIYDRSLFVAQCPQQQKQQQQALSLVPCNTNVSLHGSAIRPEHHATNVRILCGFRQVHPLVVATEPRQILVTPALFETIDFVAAPMWAAPPSYWTTGNGTYQAYPCSCHGPPNGAEASACTDLEILGDEQTQKREARLMRRIRKLERAAKKNRHREAHLCRVVKSVQDQLECGVCLQPFCHPVVLSCGHSFCAECIQEWQSARAGDGMLLTCPTCRSLTRCAVPVLALANTKQAIEEQTLELLSEEAASLQQNDCSRIGNGAVMDELDEWELQEHMRDVEDGLLQRQRRCASLLPTQPFRNWRGELHSRVASIPVYF